MESLTHHEDGWDWTGCELVERVPGKVPGCALVRGTWIVADTIAADYEPGCLLEEIEENYPALSGEVIRPLIHFAHGHRRQP